MCICCLCLAGCPCEQFCCLSESQRITKVLKKFPAILSSAAQPNGQIQKVIGRAQLIPGQLLYSPASNTPCVHYTCTVQERRTSGHGKNRKTRWVTVVTESRSVDFFVVDDNGGSVFVQGSTVKAFSEGEYSRSGGGFWGGNAASPGLEALMQRHGRATTGFFGGNKRLRIQEGSFDIGEVVCCLGGVAPGSGGPTNMMVPLQQQAITEEYAKANQWTANDKKSWDFLTSRYQCVLMSDSPKLTENLLSSMQPPPMQQGMQRQQMQQPMQQQGYPGIQPNMVTPVMAPQPTIMNVTVPAGMGPGQQLQMQTPDGRMVQVAVPAGMGPGMTFQIQV